MSGRDRTSSNTEERRSIFRGKSPWFKIGVLAVVVFWVLCLGSGVFRPDAGKIGENKVPVAPMQVHVKVPILTKKDLNGKKLVALTFDDGPSSATTPRLLDILKEKGAQVTFFALGNASSGNPEIIKREEAEGHEVATHTMRHNQLNKMSADAIRADVNEAKGVIKNILGHDPRLLRPPYGAVNDMVSNVVDLPMILWTVDTLDWKYRNTESILANTREQVFDGAIILMHDIHPTSVDAVPVLIDFLRGEGYEFVTVTQLANLRKETIQRGVLYGSFKP